MDWPALVESVLRCQPGNEQLHRVVLVLGGVSSFASIVAALYGLWRWSFGRRTHRRAATALRDEGAYRAQFNHRPQARALYDLAIQLNPRAGHVYYLSGLLHEQEGNLSRAIVDWRRSLERLPRSNPAGQKLAQYAATPIDERSSHRWVYAYGATAIVLLVAALSVLL
jgi:tetratricopeptide (TPR) repeat protein